MVYGITCAREEHTPWGLPKMTAAWELISGFHGITHAQTIEIGNDYVVYHDENKKPHRLDCDSVVLCTGMNSCQEEAMLFANLGIRCIIIGDCRKVGNIQKCVREGFAAACEF